MPNVISIRWNDDIYTKALPHLGFILHETKSAMMATKKAAEVAILTTVSPVEYGFGETRNPLYVEMANPIACCQYLEQRSCCSTI